jgi:hypothetical protein
MKLNLLTLAWTARNRVDIQKCSRLARSRDDQITTLGLEKQPIL